MKRGILVFRVSPSLQRWEMPRESVKIKQFATLCLSNSANAYQGLFIFRQKIIGSTLSGLEEGYLGLGSRHQTMELETKPEYGRI